MGAARLSGDAPGTERGGGLARLARNASIYTVGGALQKGAAFLLIPLYTRVLGPDAYGLIALATLTVPVAMAISGLGLAPAGLFYASRTEGAERARMLGTIGAALLVACVLACGLVLVLGEPLAGRAFRDGVFREVILPAALAGCLANVANLALHVHQGLEEARPYLGVVLAHALVVHGACVAAVTLVEPSAGAYARALLVGHGALALGFGARYAWRFRPRLARLALAAALAYGLPLTLHILNHWALAYVDRLLLEMLERPHAEIGCYMLGYQVAAVAGLAITSIGGAWAPIHYKRSAALAPEEAQRTLGDLASALYLALAAIASLAALLGGEVVRIVAPPAYAEASRYVPWIVGAFFLNGIYFGALFSLNAAKRNGWVTAASLLAALANAALNLVLIPRWGATGAAIATLLGYGVLAVLVHAAAARLAPLRYDGRTCALAVLATAVAVAAALTSTEWSTGPRLALEVTLSAALLAALFVRARAHRSVLSKLG